ncbi:cupin domain-containing protein [Aphanothece hegewaldii CCALA 016]|uniref:Cupin domain-containing protein n=1 Tax=Aphanothece hegewaldii CCALA 016 TaxID=2107694 RepID=A0A2T1LZL4_9CHRO|nr:quercetin 2,3-dioxygenase [Aphanothece hegewaldii]PSF37864.1 cupin domain-containing protein [Aphanothece hegewaldii CCALA 016]
MTSQLMSAPKCLLPSEGESYNLLDSTFTIKISGQETEGQWIMYEIVAPTGHEPPLHSHPWDETFYVLDGEMEVQVNQVKTLAKAGCMMFVPKNVPHTFKVCSPTAKMLVILAPASADAFYREYGEKIKDFPTLEDLKYFGDKYGIRAYF